MILQGQKINGIRTLKSWHDHDSIELWDDEGHTYRMKVSEFLKIINDLEFTTEKKRVHTYLEIETY